MHLFLMAKRVTQTVDKLKFLCMQGSSQNNVPISTVQKPKIHSVGPQKGVLPKVDDNQISYFQRFII